MGLHIFNRLEKVLHYTLFYNLYTSLFLSSFKLGSCPELFPDHIEQKMFKFELFYVFWTMV